MILKRIIWHHTGDDYTGDQFDKINAAHKARDFPKSKAGFYVGYHYLIEHDGSIRQARALDEIGAHDRGENLDSAGIALAGNFNITLPGEAQTLSACKVLGEMLSALKISITNIEPHRRDDHTACPGKRLGDDWLLKQYLRRHSRLGVKQFHLLGVHEGLL